MITSYARKKQGLKRLERIRRDHEIFSSAADVKCFEAGNNALLGVKRRLNGQVLTMVYNFSDQWQHTELQSLGKHLDLFSGKELDLIGTWELPPYGFVWLLSQAPADQPVSF